MGAGTNRVESFPEFQDLESPPQISPHAAAAVQPLEIHKVGFQQKKTTFRTLKQELREIFFPDDPLHQFKNKSRTRKLLLGLQYIFPIIQWGSEYNLQLLKSDTIAGLTIASLAIPQIGALEKGVNPPSADMLYFQGSYMSLVIKTGFVTGILSLTEGIAVGRTFASLKNYQVDGNKEMMAIGLMNMAGSCTSCYVTTGSFSRSAVNYNAGSKTAASNIVMASVVLITMLFLMPLFYYTPNVILSVIIITAVVGLIDLGAAVRLWKVDKLDFMACLGAFLGVLFISVQIGLMIALGISMLKILLHVTRPNIVILGNIPGSQNYRSLGQYKEAIRIPSFIILGIESPLYFANSMYLHDALQNEIELALK